MFAIIETGGKQYRVTKDDVISIEKIAGKPGDNVTLDQVLLLNDDKDINLGTPLLKGAKVSATIVNQAKADKVIVFKKKRRHNYRRLKGHRQELTYLKITDISTTSSSSSKAEK
ncbi:MAG: 50S ribosomal protein L21 [Rickettsiales bacterium]|nr:50S ribosomal protein L21 [Rickettsiales bacterium]MBV30920.1 50S ribosomal protein L21 [Rickettsiales bacterium]HAE76151.1 50S ribosomal protein L21 [Alphaproteobacteria bacterium]